MDTGALRNRLLDQHGVVIKTIDKRWFNGIRLSPHIFNTEADIDRALSAIRTELG